MFKYSLDGLPADEGTEEWDDCFVMPPAMPDLAAQLGVDRSAYTPIMGRTAYEGMARAMPTVTDHPHARTSNAALKEFCSRSPKAAAWGLVMQRDRPAA